MLVPEIDEFQEGSDSTSDRLRELKAFDDTKAGVKGLVDAKVTKVPGIFIHQRINFDDHKSSHSDFDSGINIPVIDLKGMDEDLTLRTQVIDKVLSASEKWGFFQIVNHGIPESVLDEVIDGIRRFHEQDTKIKREFYSRNARKKVMYLSNYDLFTCPAASWKDSLGCFMAPCPPDPEELPGVCRDILMDYSKQVMRLGFMLLELISEALGLSPTHLKDMDYAEQLLLLGHYYPACPEPELTIGTRSHSDSNIITVLAQDQMGGLQVLHENKWLDVHPTPGALVVNVGDLLQLISNDKLKSVNHRVLAKCEGPRISVACFFRAENSTLQLYAPIKELLSEENPPVYEATSLNDYLAYYKSKGPKEGTKLTRFKLLA